MLLNILRDERQFNKTGIRFALLSSVTENRETISHTLAKENRGVGGEGRIWRRRWCRFEVLFHGLLRKVIGLGLSGKGLCICYYCAEKGRELRLLCRQKEKREKRGKTVSQEEEKKSEERTKKMAGISRGL